MAKLPAISGADAIREFEKAGFRVVRIKGSHHILKKPGFRGRLTIPVHTHDLGRG
jgi:predicted RNA binding protein YcfA (HicA-like mRNA interferase family)